MADVSEANAQIELLDQNLKKTHQLSSRMTGILAHFDTRLNRLERTILPLHQSTQASTRLQSNIDATIAALSTVRSHQAESQSSSDRLVTPPTSLNRYELGSYLEALDKVVERCGDLKASGLSGGEGALREATKLAETSYKHLCRLLSSTLLAGSPSTPPPLTTYLAFPPSPSSALSTFGVLTEAGLVAYLAESPLATGGGRRDWEEVWRVWGALRGEWIRSGVVIPPGSVGDDDIEGKLVEGWLACAKTEHLLLLQLFPPSVPPSITLLTNLLSPSLLALKSQLLGHLQSLRKDPLPWRAYSLFASLAALSDRWDEFFDVTGATGGEWLALDATRGREQGEVGKALRGACTRAIPEAVESAKVSSVIRSGETPSVAVASTTTETVAYLLTLPSHASTVEQFLYALGDRKWLMGAAPPTLKDGDSLLEHFVYDVVAALVNSLEARSKAMRPGVGGIYFINNMTFVRDHVILNAPAEVGELLSDATEDFLNKSFRTAKAAYLQPFLDISRPLDSIMSSTPRQTAKDTLVRFWDALDALEATHRSYRLAGGDVRERMRDEVKKLVGGSYEGCVGRLRGSLGVKYIRITPDELNLRLDGLVR